MEKPREQDIDPRVFDLYDEYCHGHITRREFLSRAAVLTVGGVSALWMAQALMPRYAEARRSPCGRVARQARRYPEG